MMWIKEDDELYKEVLKKPVCSMVHLSVPSPPSTHLHLHLAVILELYKEVLRKHRRFMIHLWAALPPRIAPAPCSETF